MLRSYFKNFAAFFIKLSSKFHSKILLFFVAQSIVFICKFEARYSLYFLVVTSTLANNKDIASTGVMGKVGFYSQTLQYKHKKVFFLLWYFLPTFSEDNLSKYHVYKNSTCSHQKTAGRFNF